MGKKKHKEIKGFNQNDLKFYYGIPHCHTNFSTGKGNPLEAYEYGRKAGLNFMFVTDHNSFLSNKVSIKDSIYTRWQGTHYYASRLMKKYEEFLPLVGFECKTDSYGDLNIMNSSTFFTGIVKDIKILLLWMLNNENAFISINHPHKNIRNLSYNPILNKLITSIEVGNGNPAAKYTRHDKHYFNLLDAGWKLGAINGQDNHKINFGDSENLTVYIGNELSKSALVDSFRAMRTYSTESRFLKFYFTINDSFMGETILISDNKLKFLIYAEDIRYRIKEISIISNKGTTIKDIDEINLNHIKYIYEHKHEENETWYVIKVVQENNRIAISSPIFVESAKEVLGNSYES
ncbi:CehA/McbA family metallohydrolase [Clostridium chauvoei]|uniref:CehA/McbA family metallohydrolase n=2 Tax=Clostridium chauvoei TaxID=46867 RepID=A0ABD4RJ26_9CLOT|nr:CehA/McbA family metallohydrolase [Clostridium chauvoei]ATD54757.1 histidinol phosphatase [Clostridium chauvoei]ATD57563.1 histidinol phosphatase [Clostridium chauvoei]MBX7281252.1 CehA/McbA family metallohydrolase [Clostridium chauvoei]MBX7283734.1 CehA/McbA family metallohydrolase [Clostridium chauvoei]MBX7286366.1 CehA/McbA family metallohydrolase [Clostridium chauvoei]